MSNTFKFTIAVALVAMLASCDRLGQKSEHGSAGTQTTAADGEHKVRVKRACADEIQKYCANEPHKRRCLRDNRDKLGDSCKAALDAPRDHDRKGSGKKQDKDSQQTDSDD